MSKTANVLQVLRLFDDRREPLRATDVAALLKVSSATAYRYLAELESEGLIERASAASYVLGPTIVELDRQIRINDPLIAAAGDVMRILAERTGATVILSRLHARKVVCVSEVRGRFGPTAVSYERGRAMPLYRGATSKVIFAHMPPERVRAIAQADPQGLRKAGLPARPKELLDHLALLREQRVCTTAGEVDPDAMGWAVPLHHARHLLGSLSAIYSRTAPQMNVERIADQVSRAGYRIEGRLESV
jgi:DNA-binding IclR family transcriptional regulator